MARLYLISNSMLVVPKGWIPISDCYAAKLSARTRNRRRMGLLEFGVVLGTPTSA